MELNDSVFKSVKFLFAQPCYVGYYQFALDDVHNMQIIDKQELQNLLYKLGCADFMKIQYLLERNLPIFYNCKTKKIGEFASNTIDKETIIKQIQDELKADNTFQPTPFDYYFGKDSDFFRQDIYSERLRQWQS